jgi:UDP-N-acetylmuramoyl-L-alanyl-D-glutamate--2,6-diaminopimelate ligase
LNSILTFVNRIKNNGRIILVFGAPGVRDKKKRPKMGQIADKMADIIVLTDDDPDTEDRVEIIKQIKEGISREIGDNFYIVPERPIAIKTAYEIAQP